MNDLPRQKLREIVARHGQSVALDRRRCEGLLRDYCGQYRREVSVLVMALEEGVAADLLARGGGTPRAALLARLAARLCDHLAMSADAARWAVGSWALALGVVTGEELARLEEAARQAVEVAPTHAGTTNPQPSVPTPRTAAAPASAPRVTLVVAAGGGGDYRTISEALRNAAPGSCLLVRPGLYEESLVIDKPVEIEGDGRREEITVASRLASCVQMATDQAAVRGLTLRGRAGGAGEMFFAVDIPQGRLILEDCDVSSESLSCVGIRTPAADPLIRRCAIHGGADSGVYVFEMAAGTIEDCDIYRNANVNVAVAKRARPAVKGCKIHDGGDAGVAVWDGGAGVIEGCEIYGNRSAGVGVSEGGEPAVRRCQIFRGQNAGVLVHRRGRALLEDCNVFGNREANVAVTLGGDLTARECLIHNGKSSGALAREDGRVRLVGCEINGNADAGVAVEEGGVAAIHGCKINRNGSVAVRVRANGAASVEGCDLTDNGVAAWEADYGAVVESRRNRQ